MRDRTAVRRPLRLGLVGALLAFCFVGLGALGPQTAAAGTLTEDGTTARTSELDDAERDQARYYAERLRAHPVYVSDQAPRAMPRSAASDFRAQARRLTTPTYVLVLPKAVTATENTLWTTRPESNRLLAEVQRELGRDGLYVLMDSSGLGRSGGLDSLAVGVDLPTTDASGRVRRSLPDDATALDHFTRFVDALNGVEIDDEQSSDLYTSHETRAINSQLTGGATVVLPVAVLLVGLLVIRRNGWSPRLRWLPVVGAVGLGLLIPPLAAGWATETRASGAPDPTERDLGLRVERVVEGLRQEPVYVDVEQPPPLEPSRLRALTQRVRALDVPLYLVILPSELDDESAGDQRVFLERVHGALGQDGLYVAVDVTGRSDGFLTMVNHGARLAERELREMPEGIRYALDRSPGERKDPDRLYQRTTKLVEHVANTPTGPPGRPYPMDEAADPVEENTLDPLLSGPFWSAFGVSLGMVLVLELAVALRRPPRFRRGATSRKGGDRPGTAVANHPFVSAPAEPSDRWLRRTLSDELKALSEELAAFSGSERSRVRAWECLDTATLLWHQHGPRGQGQLTGCELATALTLVRAGRAALDTSGRSRERRRGGTRSCHLNPLHGKAPYVVDLAPAHGGGTRKARSVCAGCAADVAATGKSTEAARGRAPALDRRLRLPHPGRGGDPVPYDQLPGPLGAVAANGDVGVTALISQVKERLGVHS